MKPIFERFFSIISIIFVLGATPAQAQSAVKVLVVGDSLVAGAQLQPEQIFSARLMQKMKDVGFTGVGVSSIASEGQTTAIGADKIQSIIDQQPDVVLLAFGLDDMMRGVAIKQTYTNLAFMAGKLVQSGAYVVVLGIHATGANLEYSYVQQFERMFQLVASSQKTLMVANVMQGVEGNSALTLADGVHPNGRGVDVMVENTYRFVDTCIRTRIQNQQYQREYNAYKQNAIGVQGR